MNNLLIDPARFIHGAISGCLDEQQFYRPIRFSDEQLEEYRKSSDFSVRASAAAGMSVEMQTDGEKIEFMYKVDPGSSADLFSFDLTVNGRLFSHHSGKLSETREGACSFVLPKGDKTIQLYLPCLAQCSLGHFVVCGAAYCHEVSHKKRVLFMGDSITQGYTVEFPSMSFPAIVAGRLGAELLNQSIGGEMFHPEIVNRPCGWAPTHIVVCYGTNEWAYKSREEFIADSSAFYANLEKAYPDVPIAVLSPIWRANKYTRREDNTFLFDETDELIQKAIEKHDSMFMIHGKDLFPEIEELMEDNILHPNDLGNMIYADRLYSLLPESWK